MPHGVPLGWMSTLWETPLVVDGADASRFTDVDGNVYVDFSLGITIASAGHTHPAVVDAVTERVRRGTQFVLPTEDAIAVSEELARRTGLPKWQYALTATQAMTDAIRLARATTGRDRLLVFDGKYHGHVAETLVVLDDGGRLVPEYAGVVPEDFARTVVVDWNDLDAVEAALAGEDVALVIGEPVLTNSTIVFPEPGFHDGLRRLADTSGALLAMDETQTLPCAFGGLTAEWRLEPDLLVLGKSLGGGVPVAAYGMRDAISALIEAGAPQQAIGEPVDDVAIGGTTFGNALSMAAARATLEHAFTREVHARMTALAGRLAAGLAQTIDEAGLPWSTYHLGNRAGTRFTVDPPRTNREAIGGDDHALRGLQRVFLANRGVWDMGWWCGPAVSAQTTEPDVDAYLSAFDAFVAALAV